MDMDGWIDGYWTNGWINGQIVRQIQLYCKTEECIDNLIGRFGWIVDRRCKFVVECTNFQDLVFCMDRRADR